MTLAVQPWGFAHLTYSGGATPATVTQGTSVTAKASNNQAGATSVSVLTAIPHDVHYLVIGFSNTNVSTGNSSTLADVRIDPAGGSSWASAPLIDDLAVGNTLTQQAGIAGMELYYHFPLWIKAGASLGVRAATAHTADLSCRVMMWAYGEPSRPDAWWCGQKVETLGNTAASSSGVSVQAGDSGTYGPTPAQTIGTSGYRYGAIQMGVQFNGTTMTAMGYYWRLLTGGIAIPGSAPYYMSCSGSEVATRVGSNMPIWCDIPSGTVIQAQGTGSTTSAQAFDVITYGVS